MSSLPRLRLLVWDAPNMDVSLGEVLGNRPTRATRPDLSAVTAWLCRRDGDVDLVEACLFVNVPPHMAKLQQPFVHAVRTAGFSVFAKPKVDESDDIDDALVTFVRQKAQTHRLTELFMGTHDQELVERSIEAAGDEVRPTLVGFEELAYPVGGMPEGLEFVDLEDVPGTFAEKLSRALLSRLPREGMLLPPLRPLAPVRP
jgi:putative heme uptake system protein